MKSVISLLNKCNYNRRQINSLTEIQDGIVFLQLEDEYFQTNLKKYLWAQIVHTLQETRIKHKLDVRKFDEDVESGQELSKFIRYFVETLLHVRNKEIIYVMQTCPIQQQQEIAAFLENEYVEMGSFYQDLTQNEFHTTSTIISLEENLSVKENQLKKHIRDMEQMKQEYESQILDYVDKINQLSDLCEKLYDQQTFFLQKCNCSDFEEAWGKFEQFTKELILNKKQIDDLNQIVHHQTQELDKIKSKYRIRKSLWESNPPTARTVEIEQVIVKDAKEQKQIEFLQKKIEGIKEENQRVLEVKQSQYESEITKLRRQLYEAEKETNSLKKKMRQQQLELEDLQYTKEPEVKKNFESLKHQGIISQSNSIIVDFDYRFGQSPKSVVIGDMFDKTKLDIEHGPFFKGQEDNIQKLQQQLVDKTNKIAILEKQIAHQQQAGHSRRSSMSKFNTIQQEKQYFDTPTLLEVFYYVQFQNLRFYVQYSQQKDQEIKEIRGQQNSNFVKLTQCVIKQNEQIQTLNSQLIHQQDEEYNQNLVEQHKEELNNLNNYFTQVLDEKDELLHLIISLFYDNVNEKN